MKLYIKIFLSSIAVLIVALCTVEYGMVSQSFRTAMEQETAHELEQYRFIRMAFYLGGPASGKEQLGGRYGELRGENGGVLYSDFPESLGKEWKGQFGEGIISYEIVPVDGKQVLTVSGMVPMDGQDCTLTTGRDISAIYADRLSMEQEYRAYIYWAIGACTLLQAILAYWIVKPLNRLRRQSDKIAMGEYTGRVKEGGRDEIGALSRSFNQMAGAVEQKVEELEEEARRKEQFMGDFSHEIKTPMTAIIGYADTLYQRDCTREEVREAAGYILNEGMRLEALSRKMMKFIALGQEELCIEEIPASEFFQDMEETMAPLFQKEKASLYIRYEDGLLKAEWDLLKTLVMNLIDNARKAGSCQIVLKGTVTKEGYRLSVTDDGRGIPKESLPYIQDAFYMVDKSRSRKQNGAGLGLALCRKIAALHHTELVFSSREGKGTSVSLTLPGEGKEGLHETVC